MQALPPPPDGDQNRAPALLAIFWTPFPVIVALLCARFFVRIRIKNLGLDDYIMFLAWVRALDTRSGFSRADIMPGVISHFECTLQCLHAKWRRKTFLLFTARGKILRFEI